jgi:hypothetical protein
MGIRHVALFFFVALLAGCYQQPSAQKIQYDAEAVEELRQQVKTMDWD